MKEMIIKGDDMDIKLRKLQEVYIDGDNWFIYYSSEDGEKWVREYPNSWDHGGGEPQLRLLERFPWE